MDSIFHGLENDIQVRFSFASSVAVANEAVTRHGADPLSAFYLGRALNAGLLLNPLLTEGEKYNIRWSSDGELKTILVDMTSDGIIKGFISPVHLSQLAKEEDELFRSGTEITVIKSKDGKVLSSGATHSILSDPVTDLGYFFSISDQVETAMVSMIGFREDEKSPVNICQGMMIQAMPGVDRDAYDRVLEKLSSEEIRVRMKADISGEKDLKPLLQKLFGLNGKSVDEKLKLFKGPSPEFRCSCTAEKVGSVLRALPSEDREDIRGKKEAVNVNCQFCSKNYELSIKELERIWEE